MKKVLITISILVVVLSLGFWGLKIYTKRASPAATATYLKNGLEISVDYCRPARKGRVVFGNLEPYGKVWRTGANEATEITFNQPVSFGGKPVKPGTYTLFSIPNPDTWTVILNRELDQWGAFSYDETKDMLRVQVPATQTSTVTEQFTIDFAEETDAVQMQLAWDQTRVAVPIRPQD